MDYKKIKTLEDACKVLGTTVAEQFSAEVLKVMTPDEVAYREAKIITKALNQFDGEPWEPDWSNWSEGKYYPWPRVDTSDGNKAGSGFSDFDYDYGRTDASVGSRLCFKSSELAVYALKQFTDTYKRLLLISK